MKRILAGVAVVALMTSSQVFGQPHRQGRTSSNNVSVEQQLINLEDQSCVAAVNTDVAFFDRTTAKDFMDTWADGTVTTWAQDRENMVSGVFKCSSMMNDNYRVRVYGKTAVVTYRFTTKAQFNGNDISGQYRETDTWVKQGGQWQVVASHESKIAPREPNVAKVD